MAAGRPHPMFYVTMQPDSQTTEHAPEHDEPSAGTASGSTAVDDRTDPAEDADTVFIELNFKAFADNVPPNEHAKRAPNYSDPSVQDFADQALELAALRAELKRLTRDCEVMQQDLRSRDARLRTLRRELTSARTQLRAAPRQQSQASTRQVLPVAAEDSGPCVEPADALESLELSRPELTSTLEVPLPAPHAQSSSHQAAVPQLIPIDQLENPIVLSRDIVTIGRTRGNDVCIPSRAVSRDHARLLITRTSVTLVNVSSSNGCFVNDQPVKRHQLRDGDLVRIGDRDFRFARASGASRG